jgi:hypothetical protein
MVATLGHKENISMKAVELCKCGSETSWSDERTRKLPIKDESGANKYENFNGSFGQTTAMDIPVLAGIGGARGL